MAESEVYTWEPSDEALAARYGVGVERIVRFDTNTSPEGPEFVPSVLQAPARLNEYPDSAYQALTDAAAAYAGVPDSEIIVGAGADEILDLIGKAFLPAGGAAIVPAPSYGMYPVVTSQRDARRMDVPRRPGAQGWAMDVDGIVAALPGAQVVWLCEPNNPTGSSDGPAALERILEAAAAVDPAPIVVVDEAYHEFTGQTVIPWRDRYPHLVVVRTLSKAFGLAGIRVGWAVAARPTIARLERVRPAGSISTVSAALAAAALARPEVARARAAALAAEREWLASRLAAAGWTPYPSVTNFVLVPLGTARDADEAAQRLLRKGLVPRTFATDGPLAGHLRLTVRSREENERLLAAITA
ncbi:MAG TPA: histidinol-phosphate transaminase [Candidatus Sulfotelmatobacter sp.]|nr:histidinol-phosphate transaminase [Candidatus Sulfotelmatobacter sp.]